MLFMSVPFGRVRGTLLLTHDCWVPRSIDWEVFKQFLEYFVVNIQKQQPKKNPMKKKTQKQKRYKKILLSLSAWKTGKQFLQQLKWSWRCWEQGTDYITAPHSAASFHITSQQRWLNPTNSPLCCLIEIWSCVLYMQRQWVVTWHGPARKGLGWKSSGRTQARCSAVAANGRRWQASYSSRLKWHHIQGCYCRNTDP